MEIELTKGKKTLIDTSDYDLVSKRKWYFDRYYAATNAPMSLVRKGVKRKIYLHRFLLNAREGEEVDHINHDGLDNRRENLRVCSHQENMMNSNRKANGALGARGIEMNSTGKFRARINKDGKSIHLGVFETIEEAKIVRNEATKKYHKEFAFV